MRSGPLTSCAVLLLLTLAACEAPAESPEGSAPAGPPVPTGNPDGYEGQNPSEGTNDPRWLATDPVVLISFDGFRWDYLDTYAAPAFQRVAREGVRAEGSIPPFPSKTFPSHYSLATGLHAEGHELVGNSFWDPELEAEYSMGDREVVEDGAWYAGEPIWVTAERQGMVAASYFFVGSEADVGGVRPSFWRRYDGEVSGEARVDQVLEWLALAPEHQPKLITLYFSDVDGAGHRFGPDSPEVEEAVARVDGYLQRLLDGLDAMQGGDRVSLILVSDHGMYFEDPELVQRVDLSGMPDARFQAMGPYATLWVDGDDPARAAEVRDAVAAQLPDEIGVYLRDDVPERLHYSATPKVGEIVIVPPIGVSVVSAERDRWGGGWTHGWDPQYEEMHGILLARGPRIAPASTLGRVEHVHVYPLMAELLGLEPAEVDGELATFQGVLEGG